MIIKYLNFINENQQCTKSSTIYSLPANNAVKRFFFTFSFGKIIHALDDNVTA